MACHDSGSNPVIAMPPVFEELDFQSTPLGDISLRRRTEPRLADQMIYEVKLGDEFLMSSLFVDGEIALARLALATQNQANSDAGLDVVVGGLGLGYTAAAALEHDAVTSVVVIDVMEAVIEWHRRGLVPMGNRLSSDQRVTLHHGDFFKMALSASIGFGIGGHQKQVHAVLLDIDHSPSHWLNPGNGAFYSIAGLQAIDAKLLPGGVFGLWSNDPPETSFTNLMETVFDSVSSHIVRFPNPYTDASSTNTVYLGLKTRNT